MLKLESGESATRTSLFGSTTYSHGRECSVAAVTSCSSSSILVCRVSINLCFFETAQLRHTVTCLASGDGALYKSSADAAATYSLNCYMTRSRVSSIPGSNNRHHVQMGVERAA